MVRLDRAEIEIVGTDPAAVQSVLRTLGPLLATRRGVRSVDLTHAKIFLSYRRDDSAPIAGRVCDHLVTNFGRNSVFMDIESLSIGDDFRRRIEAALSSCVCLLALIGSKWLCDEQGRRRLEESGDVVRLEIETGLRTTSSVIAVLIADTTMPAASDLPQSIRDLASRNAARLDPGRDFHHHMDAIVQDVAQLLESR